MKNAAHKLVREAHKKFSLKPLPKRAAIYFHELEDHQLPAFARAIDYFTARGYRTRFPGEHIDASSSEPSLFVSFDDNFATWRRALPLFERRAMRAVFYVNTLPFRDTCEPAAVAQYFDRISYTGDAATLSRQDLREIRAAGHLIGCHSHSHLRLSALPRSQWDYEIRNSKTILEDILGETVSDFSYPYGMRRHFSRDLRAYCARVGFKTIATAIPGMQHAEDIDPLSLHRTRWRLDAPLQENILDLRIDGSAFQALTGRSALG